MIGGAVGEDRISLYILAQILTLPPDPRLDGSTMSLEIRLFGHLQLTDSKRQLNFHLAPRAQRLLAYLLLNRSKPIPRETVAFALSPDSTEKEALATLRRALNELRADLPPDEKERIVAARGELVWDCDLPYWLDIEEFERLVRRDTASSLHEAVDLYVGDLLLELDDEWLIVERERLRQLHLNALMELVSYHRALGEYLVALDYARQLLLLDPLSENAYRELIGLYYLNGDRGAALAAYEQLRDVLRKELGAEPMTETRALIDAINRGNPLPQPNPVLLASIPVPNARALRKPIGRESEMSELEAQWDSASSGHGRLLIVSGEAGVGKTHLTMSLADYASRRGALVLVGHCYEFEHALPYQSLVEMLRSSQVMLRHLDLAPAHRAVLARLAPDIFRIGSRSLVEESRDNRDQLFEALRQTFFSLARGQPLLLIIEDAQWASSSTLDWLTFVAPSLGASPLLLVVTCRTGEVGVDHALSRLRRRFAREASLSVLSLPPLSRAAVSEWVSQLAGLEEEGALPAANRLYEETAGNPFFLQELVRALTETGQIVVREGKWSGEFVREPRSIQVPLPDSLRETVRARVIRLEEPSREFLRAATALGRAFEASVIQQAGGWREEVGLAALEELLAREFIRPGRGESSYEFIHDLVRESIYADMTELRRVYWHKRLAGALVSLHPEDLESLAYHYAAAGQREQAIEYSVRSAQRAESVYAYDQARQHLDKALALLGEDEPREQRIALLEELADVCERSGERAAAVTALQQALALWSKLDGRGKIEAVRLHRKLVASTSGMYLVSDLQRFRPVAEESVAAGLRALEGLDPHPEILAFLTACSKYVSLLAFTPDWEAAERYAQAAVQMGKQLDSPVEFAAALEAFSRAQEARGLLRERVEVARQQLALAEDPGFADARERARSLKQLGDALSQVGEYDEALGYLDQAEQVCRAIRCIEELVFVMELQAYCRFQLDQWEEVLAIEQNRQKLEQTTPGLSERFGAKCFHLAINACVHALLGETEIARRLHDQSCAIMVATAGPLDRWQAPQHY